jgi:hypothetical protein
MTRLLRLLAVTLLAGAALVVPSSPASADYGCPGGRVVWRPFNNSNGELAAVAQAYDTADGKCVNLVAKGQYYGRNKWMRVKVCNSRRENCKVDKGYFDYYAGPVYYSAHCVWARVKMNDGYGNTIMDLWVPFGCN